MVHLRFVTLGFPVPPYVVTEARLARSRLSRRPAGPEEVKDFLFLHPEISTWMDLSTYVCAGVEFPPGSMELRRLDHFLSKSGGKEVHRPLPAQNNIRLQNMENLQPETPTPRNPDAAKPWNPKTPKPRKPETLEPRNPKSRKPETRNEKYPVIRF